MPTVDRAVGHVAPYPGVPVDEPMTAAGGLYASAVDLARFLRFQLSDGSIDGRTVLAPALMEEMRTVPAPYAGEPAGYALGVSRTRWSVGGNCRTCSTMAAAASASSPTCGGRRSCSVGIAILTNSDDHHLQGDLALSILRDLVAEPGSVYADRLLALPAQPGVEPDGGCGHRRAWPIASPRCDAAIGRRGGSVGGVRRAPIGSPDWGVIDPVRPLSGSSSTPGSRTFETDETGVTGRHDLTEVETGLFLADNGETLDLRSSPPTWRNIDSSGSRGPGAVAVGHPRGPPPLSRCRGLSPRLSDAATAPQTGEAGPPASHGWRRVTAAAAALTAIARPRGGRAARSDARPRRFRASSAGSSSRWRSAWCSTCHWP